MGFLTLLSLLYLSLSHPPIRKSLEERILRSLSHLSSTPFPSAWKVFPIWQILPVPEAQIEGHLASKSSPIPSGQINLPTLFLPFKQGGLQLYGLLLYGLLSPWDRERLGRGAYPSHGRTPTANLPGLTQWFSHFSEPRVTWRFFHYSAVIAKE